jgi:type I restriction enzyme M protein
VLFIERILKMLKPGGRAAIVLPQGKFNNSSLAFIREWILKKARLLAVVGLHPNTFKPHTGTKTSVLFVKKYTEEELKRIAGVHDDVAKNCPDYEAEIKTLLESHPDEIGEEAVSEAVMDLVNETFSEPESVETADEHETGGQDDESDVELPSQEDILLKAQEKLDILKAEIKRLENEIPQAQYELKLLTLRGKLELIVEDDDLIGTLKERWIAAEVSKRLDYPIFMAVSERGGKDNSGDYTFMLDPETGGLIEDEHGQPQIDQDLVNYDLAHEDLAKAVNIPDEKLCIAEAFVRFAQEQGFGFWRVD